MEPTAPTTPPEAYDFDLLCIGSGPAAQKAAVQAAKLGKRVAVVERRRFVGGVCVDTGTIPSKTLREAVLSFCTQRRLASSEYFAARPTAADFLARVTEVVRLETTIQEDQLRRNTIKIIKGTASFAGPHQVRIERESEHRIVTAAFILIAVGTEASHPPGVPADCEMIVTSDQITEIRELPRTLAVVGGGVVGIEYASMFAALGIPVTVVDRRDHLLDFVDHEVVDELMHQMRNLGVTFRLGESVAEISVTPGPPRRGVLQLESGKRIVGDLVLFSAGRVPATAALNLQAAGLKTTERGLIKVDACFRTEVPHIFAAGDVIGYPSLAATSMEQGRLAACNAFGLNCGPMASHFPVGIYAIPELSVVGASEQELTAQKVPYELGVARYREIARGQILGDNSGFLKLLFHRETRLLLGVHAVGTGATELIHIGQAVIGLGGGLDYFMSTVFNYPTLAECYKVAALSAANKLAL